MGNTIKRKPNILTQEVIVLIPLMRRDLESREVSCWVCEEGLIFSVSGLWGILTIILGFCLP